MLCSTVPWSNRLWIDELLRALSGQSLSISEDEIVLSIWATCASVWNALIKKNVFLTHNFPWGSPVPIAFFISLHTSESDFIFYIPTRWIGAQGWINHVLLACPYASGAPAPSHPGSPQLDLLQFLSVCVVVWCPKLSAVLQMQPHNYWNWLQPCSHSLRCNWPLLQRHTAHSQLQLVAHQRFCILLLPS